MGFGKYFEAQGPSQSSSFLYLPNSQVSSNQQELMIYLALAYNSATQISLINSVHFAYKLPCVLGFISCQIFLTFIYVMHIVFITKLLQFFIHFPVASPAFNILEHIHQYIWHNKIANQLYFALTPITLFCSLTFEDLSFQILGISLIKHM